MSTSTKHENGRGGHGHGQGRQFGMGAAATTEFANEMMQQGMAACLAMPQKLMQANLATANHAVDFMNRRMKAQATLWNGIGQAHDVKSFTEIQRGFIENATRDYGQEMTHLAEVARLNLATFAEMARGASLMPATAPAPSEKAATGTGHARAS